MKIFILFAVLLLAGCERERGFAFMEQGLEVYYADEAFSEDGFFLQKRSFS
jgi:hypothetical protein